MAAVRRGGTVSIPGVYAGPIHGFLMGDAFDKGLTLKWVKLTYINTCHNWLEHIENGDLSPGSDYYHRMANLSDAAKGCEIFENVKKRSKSDFNAVILPRHG